MFSQTSIIVILLCAYLVQGWQQPEAEYNDDSLSMMPGGGWKENLEKRNTWWTKKSIRDDELNNDMLKSNLEYPLIKKLSGCSIEKCMLMLMECVRRSENRTVLLQCKDSHITCLASCFQKYKEKFMFNSVAMAS
ncbi:uncharacterized protein CDAR_220471 [Caerostris darwini]|uniref:Uncharacterized protein n=1 Tax=Caerostris darwini TaxID=1538125 RepID=A0AAV4UFI6_9ARAC|nr:uncharacterized protein CDAR_220471 [Caerostris darwini]